MKICLVGANATPEQLRQAVSRAMPAQNEAPLIRARQNQSWAQLPNATASQLGVVAAGLARALTVIEVELSAGGRGSGLDAAAYRLAADGRSGEVDLTGEARETLHEWRADMKGGFDEEEAAAELAWSFVDEFGEDEPNAVGADSLNEDDEWAQSLLATLLEDGSLQLKPGKSPPQTWVADALARGEGEHRVALVLEALTDAPEVEEVFLDDEELAARIEQSRPPKAAHRGR